MSSFIQKKKNMDDTDDDGTPATTEAEAEIYQEALLARTVLVSVDRCNPALVKNHFTELLRKEMEGKCISQGYVKPASVRDLEYSVGVLKSGEVSYRLRFKCDICLPAVGAHYSAKFVSVNTAGIYAELVDEQGNIPVCFFVNRDYRNNASNPKFLQYDNPEYAAAHGFFQVKVLFVHKEVNDPCVYTIAQIM